MEVGVLHWTLPIEDMIWVGSDFLALEATGSADEGSVQAALRAEAPPEAGDASEGLVFEIRNLDPEQFYLDPDGNAPSDLRGDDLARIDTTAIVAGPSTRWIEDPFASDAAKPPTATPVLGFSDDEMAWTFPSALARGFMTAGTRLAGGLGSPEFTAMQDGQVIVVTGWLLDGAGGHTFRGLDGPFQGGYDNPTLEPGGGGGGYEIPAPVPNETPCVNENARPSGASMRDINTAALAAANAIEAKDGVDLNGHNDEEHVEWGSLIFIHNGSVGFTEPFTQNSEDSIGITVAALNVVPDGAVIVGFVHNHTALGLNSGMNQRAPSSADWQIRDGLIGYSIGRGVTVDNNMLLYIHAPNAAGIHDGNKTRVYDKTDRNEASECSLQ